MKVSTRGEYGVRAMVALARHHGQGSMSIAAMSKASGVPMPYLEQLIGPLRRAGLVESKRGARGGYQLTRDPGEVAVGEVYRIMEGPVAPMECVSEDVTEQTCPLIDIFRGKKGFHDFFLNFRRYALSGINHADFHEAINFRDL